MEIKKIIFLLIGIISFINAKPVTINIQKTNIETFKIQYFYDKSQKLNINNILKIKRFKTISNILSLGYKKGNNWVKFSIKNPTNKKIARFVGFSEDFYSVFDFFVVKSGKVIQVSKNGLKVPMKNRKIKDMLPVFVVRLMPHETKTIYVKFNTAYGIFGKFVIQSYIRYITYRFFQNYFYFLYYGVILTILLYNIFIYIFLRERIYLLYITYISIFFIPVMLYSGFILYFVDGEIFQKLQIAFPSTFFILTIFTQQVLKVKQMLPKLNSILNFFKILLIICAIWIAIDINSGFYYTSLVTTLTLITLIITGILSIKKGTAVAFIYVLALCSFFSGMILFNLLQFGIIPYNTVTRNFPFIGSAIEMILFSLALAGKMYTLKNERLAANKKLLKLTTEQNRLLTLRVEKQTKRYKLLLKELQHRVKNNFQSILTFLWLQKQLFKNEDAIEAFEMTCERIRAMSYIHELFYIDSNKKISLKPYIQKFVQSVANKNDKIDIQTKISFANISTEKFVSLGMILNELITNSYKYAFKNIKNPQIIISFSKKDGYNTLYYKDNGIGFDKEILNKSKSLGYKLIQTFTQKLPDATLEIETNNGVTCIVKFKDEHE